ncbi:sensor histidine kinase [Nonomuraea maritima]|nr:histidine kinase [Nonomuraea maritima]
MRFVLLGGAMSVLTLAVLDGQMGVPSDLPMPVQLTIAAAAGLAAWHARRSWWPLAVLGAVAYAGLVVWPPLMLASYYAGRTLPRPRGIAAYLAACVAVCGIGAIVGEARDGLQELLTASLGNALFMMLGVIGLPVALGLWTGELLRAAKERAERLEREQVMRAEQARTQERARIAREMHDVVAHRVSLVVLHAGALEVRASDEETVRAAALIGGIGREALANLRDVLGVLRSPEGHARQEAALRPPPTLGDLDRLLDQSRALGITVTRHDEGEPRPVEPTVERTAYRVVQEALTNVHKHAGDAGTRVRIHYGTDALEVEVRNDAPAPSGAADTPPRAPRGGVPGAGWGLVGLRERVELLGGTLRTSAQDGGGFLVSARIPA